MKNQVNMVAHYEAGTSDKIYMACIRFDPASKVYTVLGKWGRRGKTLQSQPKCQDTNRLVAEQKQKDLFESKLSEGYVDIDSGSYRGSLTRNDREVKAAMELDWTSSSSTPKQEPKIPLESERMLDGETMVAVCVNNTGMEDRFDVGTSYVFKVGNDKMRKGGMVQVWDKLGKMDEYLTERFRFVKEE